VEGEEEDMERDVAEDVIEEEGSYLDAAIFEGALETKTAAADRPKGRRELAFLVVVARRFRFNDAAAFDAEEEGGDTKASTAHPPAIRTAADTAATARDDDDERGMIFLRNDILTGGG